MVFSAIKRLNVLYEKNWTELVTEQLRRFEKAVVESKKIDASSSSSSTPHWNFGEALLYSVTLLTTVGYSKLSPKTALGKVVTMIYAMVGVPLMLVLLSALGSLLASGAKKTYLRLCCHNNSGFVNSPSVGYHKAPSSPSGKQYCKSYEDSISIQASLAHNMPNHANFRLNHHTQYNEQAEIPKRTLLATVRGSQARGRLRQVPIRQTLSETANPFCPMHLHHALPLRNMNSSIVGISSDLEEADDADDSDQVVSHDTPSRVPLIWRTPEHERSSPVLLTPSPSVPALIVFIIFVSYVCIGAFAFSTVSSKSFLDAIYFCFIALSTIGITDNLPQTSDFHTQIHLFACCVYIFLGLIIVAMCFGLVQEGVAFKCRQAATTLGLLKN